MKRTSWIGSIGGGFAFLTFAAIAAAQPAALEAPPLAAQPATPVAMPNQPGALTGPSDGPYTIWETVALSIFTKHAPKREWTPLYASTFLTEGWLEPQIDPPNGSGGSVRQGWVGVPDAFFNRQIILGIYSYARGANGNQNEQVGGVLIESPISRRWDVGFIVPYVDNLEGAGRSSATSFGDVTIENRFLLHETQDLTVSLNLNIRVPTGSTITGNDRTVLDSYLAFYKDLGVNGWSVRGAAGAFDPVSGPNAQRITTLFQSIGVGQTITPHDIRFFGDFTYYVCANVSEDLNTTSNAFMSLTPGIRTHLGREWFFLFGVDVPVTPNAGFRERFNVFLLKGF